MKLTSIIFILAEDLKSEITTTMLNNPKTRSILKLALFYSFSMVIFLPLIEIIGGKNFNQALEDYWFNPRWLALSVIIFFSIGLFFGWLNWKQLQKRNPNN